MRCLTLALLLPSIGPAQQGPDQTAQREAMKKLSFLVGNWSGDGTVFMQSGSLKVQQTESVQYNLDGLVLMVEGTGRNAAGEIAFRAFATIAFDDAAHAYRCRRPLSPYR